MKKNKVTSFFFLQEIIILSELSCPRKMNMCFLFCGPRVLPVTHNHVCLQRMRTEVELSWRTWRTDEKGEWEQRRVGGNHGGMFSLQYRPTRRRKVKSFLKDGPYNHIFPPDKMLGPGEVGDSTYRACDPFDSDPKWLRMHTCKCPPPLPPIPITNFPTSYCVWITWSKARGSPSAACHEHCIHLRRKVLG